MLLRVALGLAVLCALAAWPGAAQPADSCPLSFTATPNGPGTVTFHWVGFGGAEGYQVFGRQGQGNTAGYSPMLSGDARDWTASNLASGDYLFWVDAFHGGSVVAESCERATTVEPTLAAACPTGVTAAIEPPDQVVVMWSRVDGATGYRIARQVDGGAIDDAYGTAGQSNHPTFVDTAAPAGHAYTYRVASQNTREPPEACSPVTAEAATVPEFPTVASWVLAGAATLIAALAIARR